MIWLFAFGCGVLGAGFFASVSHGLQRVLIRTGWVCLATVAVLGDFNARAAAVLFVLLVVCVVVTAFLYWLDDGRFTQKRVRASVGWFFAVSGPGAPPMRHGFVGLAVLTLVVLTALLVVRPVARMAMGLDAKPETVMMIRGIA